QQGVLGYPGRHGETRRHAVDGTISIKAPDPVRRALLELAQQQADDLALFLELGFRTAMRDEPGGNYVMTLLNGTIVETFSEFQVVNNITWVKVYAQVNGQRIEGWLLESVISYVTPAPNFQASSTPQGTPTP
ncbi:MAG: hypothetical protein HYU84_10000, partial [Chloroflexi bacterium]|nr:hypothetical protein [Chloroflexota bacterium]